MMQAKLTVKEGRQQGASLSLEQGESWIIGNDPELCQLLIGNVADAQLLVRRTTNGFEIENLDETHPLLINNQPATATQLLRSGDQLRIEGEVIDFEEVAEEEDNEKILSENAISAEITSDETGADAIPSSEQALDAADQFPINDTLTDTSLHQEGNLNPEDNTQVLADNLAAETDPSSERVPTNEPPFTENVDTSPPARYDTIFDEEHLGALAEIDFGISDTGRWLLKVISGPNNGAEFYMQPGQSYIVGTDPQSCDVVFNDSSVSRQHLKISVSPEDVLSIEDLESRNGTFIDGTAIKGLHDLTANTIVTLGTTSFVIYDREGEMHTIISPLLPSLIKTLNEDPSQKASIDDETINQSMNEYASQNAESGEEMTSSEIEQPLTPTPVQEKLKNSTFSKNRNLFVMLACLIGFLMLAGVGTVSLFRSEPTEVVHQANADELIKQVLKAFPAVRYSYNTVNDSLILTGHVATPGEKTQLLYQLQGLKFIKSIDDAGMVIDEFVWQESNSILSKNPAWKGITLYSPKAGEFVLSGYLATRKQADDLLSYMSLNFAYMNLLQKQVIVEEDVINEVLGWLQESGLVNVVPKVSDGNLNLSGAISSNQATTLNEIITRIKQIPGMRIVNNYVREQVAESGRINISDRYAITGRSSGDGISTVVINGRILSEGDILDGMDIVKITTTTVLLNKGDAHYQIDY